MMGKLVTGTLLLLLGCVFLLVNFGYVSQRFVKQTIEPLPILFRVLPPRLDQ